jgi:putative spermidine/putrescine transport system ATP-binding protein/spermidine/putrescine transport system ATP-binding protein
MRREIDNLQQLLGVTTIFVTHDQREALSMSDKIIVMNDGLKQQEGSPEEVYNYPRNHFVSDFLGHSNFFGGVISGVNAETVSVKLRDGNEFRVRHPGDWVDGEPVELVVRAQKFELTYPDEAPPEPEMNSFNGTIKDRSYMGGEVSYFVELDSGTRVHVIGIAKLTPFKKGERIRVHVAPRHCGLLRTD